MPTANEEAEHMKLTIIDDLLKSDVKRRKKVLLSMHEKNIAYFRKHAPESLANELVVLGTGRFELRINEAFLDILDRSQGGACCHPPGRLLDYVRDFGGWHHTAWHDRLSVTHSILSDDEHSQIRQKFVMDIYEKAPALVSNRGTGKVVLPKLKDGRRYSGTTIFLGIHSGLHIVQYLNTTVVKDAIFIEPDMECLALSCFFLDYGALHRRFGRVMMHVGPDLPENPLDYLVTSASVTSAVWLRMLPAYPSDKFDEIIRRISMRWNAFHEIRVPFDREMRNLGYGAKNLRSGLPVLAGTPALSARSRIVVVGSGPSLDKDLPWLAENQHRLIIIAAHSAAKVLKKAGVKPDFYCTLDTEIPEDLLKKLDMDPDVSLLAYYKASPSLFEGFREVLLYHEENKANAVRFNVRVDYTHPTSGNSSVAMAVFFRPKNIFLAGMDLGFRDANRSHASGTWHDEDEGAGHAATLASDVLPGLPNFDESKGQIFTYSYLNNARGSVEAALGSVAHEARIVNFSDGVKIAFATAAKTSDSVLDAYPEKQADLEAIRGAFSTDVAAVWTPYDRSAAVALDGFRQRLKDRVKLKQFDWLQFAQAVDDAWRFAATATVEEGGGDFRIEVFTKLIHDLLMDWYRVLCHTITKSEAESAYRFGFASFSAVLDSLKFTAELEDL
jgi:hypothetical protein